MKKILVSLICLLMVACASAPEPRGENLPPDVARPAAQARQNPAVISLMEEAETYRANGQLEPASASLERALRISPRDPVLRERLGWLRLEQGDPFQAKELARMAVVYATGRPLVQASAWELIAEAEAKIGNTTESELARQEAARLREHQ